MKKSVVYLLLLTIALGACSKVAITKRKQFKLVPQALMLNMSKENYVSFIKGNKLSSKPADNAQVRNVGVKISKAVNDYFTQSGNQKQIADYNWEFNVVESPEVNAWCMPGGKVVFYTGILPVCQDEQGIAVVMGHEIAHAIADHGNERMSQQLLAQAGGIGVNLYMQQKPEATRQIFNQAFGLGSNLGILAFSRKHELEADKLGLVFMAMAGYDPHKAVDFWKRMAANSASVVKPPELLSTHPLDTRRIADIEKYLPEALKYYKGN